MQDHDKTEDVWIAVVDDDVVQRSLLERWLEREGYRVASFDGGASFLAALDRLVLRAVCLDLRMPGLSGFEVLEAVRAHDARLPVVILTADSDVDLVVEAMRGGAFDFLVKPIDRTHLGTTIRNAVERHEMAVRLAQMERTSGSEGYLGIVGASPPMKRLYERTERVAPTDVPVLVYGESGSGKELVARAIHRASSRGRRAFVALNCAAIPEQLQESELFGHEKGAFTGAVQRRMGRFEEAAAGTLFLDEVAELAPELQAKLLRVLQEKTFRRVGGDADLRSDFRLVAATHRDLQAEVEAGRFREDLYYRIAVFELEVPPLRDRLDDIPLLASRLLGSLFPGLRLGVSPEAFELLRQHLWPGNVRELGNALQHAAVLASDGVIRPEDLPKRMIRGIRAARRGDSPEAARRQAELPVVLTEGIHSGYEEEESASATRQQADSPEVGLEGTDSQADEADEAKTLAELEEVAIRAALRRTGGNRTEMARQLGIGRTTLYRKLEKLGLDGGSPLSLPFSPEQQ